MYLQLQNLKKHGLVYGGRHIRNPVINPVMVAMWLPVPSGPILIVLVEVEREASARRVLFLFAS